nr:hypothetical protein [Mycobacterium sp. 1164985.4]
MVPVAVCQLKLGIVLQDSRFEVTQVRARVDAEFRVESPAQFRAHPQRLGLTARPIQRQHELGVQPFSEWICCRESFKLRDQRMVSAQRQIGVDSVTKCYQPELLKARRLGCGELRLTQILEHSAAPQAQRFAQHSSGPFGVSGSQRLLPFFQQVLEPGAVDLAPTQEDPITGLLSDGDVVDAHARQTRPEPRHVSPQCDVRARRRCATPDRVCDAVR